MKNLADVKFESGSVLVIPTDTVYGLACSARDKGAVERLYNLKNREKKPGTIIAASIDQLVDLGIKRRYLTAVEHFWPNQISVIVPTEPSLSYLDLGLMSLPIRIVADEDVNKLLLRTGPLLTSSANLPGEPPANNVDEAKKYFEDKVDGYIDGGDFSGRQPSTLIRVVDDALEILREGAVKIDESGRIIL